MLAINKLRMGFAISLLLFCSLIVNSYAQTAPASSSPAGPTPENLGTSSNPSTTGNFGLPVVSDLGTDLSSSNPNAIIFDPASVGQDYVLGAGDVFDVIVHPQTDYSVTKIIVNQDGAIDYPRVGEIAVSGDTLRKAKADIVAKLSDYCIDPSISINLVALRPQVVYVTGGVSMSHILDVRAASNVAKAVTLAGGATDRNQLLHVAVLRGDSVLHSNVYPILVNGQTGDSNNIDLQAGDIVVVPINTQKYAISGAIAKPGIYPLTHGEGSNEGFVRLSDAIAQAGGTQDGISNIGSVRIIRRDASGNPVTVSYDYGKALKGDESQNPIIGDRDSIYVPTKSKHVDPFQVPTFIYLFKFLGL